MGGLVKILPLTYATMLIGSLALMGFPFLTGFYSKDVILEIAYGSFILEGRFVHTLGTMAAFFTAYYSTRLLAMTYLRSVNGNKYFYEHAHESSFNMALPLILLSFGSIFIGYTSRDMMIGLGTDFWGNAIFTLPTKQHNLEAEWLDSSIKMIPLFFSFLGIGLGVYNYLFTFNMLYNFTTTSFGRHIYTFLNRKWFFDKVYNEWISQTLLNIAYRETYQNMDRGLLEFFGPQGISMQIYTITTKLNQIPMGFIFHYLFLLLGGLILLLFIFSGWLYISMFIDFSLFIIVFLILFLYKF
jgi:NADH-ubiquinone oxidoreductase chain 5